MIKRCLLEVAENMENVKIQFVILSDKYGFPQYYNVLKVIEL